MFVDCEWSGEIKRGIIVNNRELKLVFGFLISTPNNLPKDMEVGFSHEKIDSLCIIIFSL